MKFAQTPKAFTFVFISFAFLIIQFGLIIQFLAFPTQNQLAIPENTQSIPETFFPVVVDGQGERASSDTRVLPPPRPAQNLEPTPTSGPGITFATGAQDGSSVDYASSLTGDVFGDAGLDTEDSYDLEFESFRQEMANGDPQTVTGLYVAGLLRLRVIQQPAQDVAFVSNEDGTVTQFQTPTVYGVIGLLAHNFLSGKHFFNLAPGHEIRIVYGNGSFRSFRVSGLADFERLTRFDIRSDFRDLQTDEVLSSQDLFTRFYREENYLTLQTCLEGGGYSNWGVRMISAVPID